MDTLPTGFQYWSSYTPATSRFSDTEVIQHWSWFDDVKCESNWTHGQANFTSDNFSQEKYLKNNIVHWMSHTVLGKPKKNKLILYIFDIVLTEFGAIKFVFLSMTFLLCFSTLHPNFHAQSSFSKCTKLTMLVFYT